MVKELTVVIKNQPNELAKVTEILKDANVDIVALNVIPVGNGEGEVRILVDKIDEAKNILSGKGIKCAEKDVLIIETENKVGALNNIVSKLNGLNLEYVYTIGKTKTGKDYISIGVNDYNSALDLAKKSGLNVSNNV